MTAGTHWLKVRFRDEQVLASCDATGALAPDENAMVPFCYRPGGRLYRTRAERLAPVDGAVPSQAPAEAPKEPMPRTSAPRGAGKRIRAGDYRDRRPDDQALQIWTDGACSGNPGPAGIGVVLRHAGAVQTYGEYLGSATNNIAELTAILRGLKLVPDAGQPVDVLSDSQYAIGLLAMGWKAKANQALVAELRQVLEGFQDVRLLKVPGHAGVAENELADELAREAILSRHTAGLLDRTERG